MNGFLQLLSAKNYLIDVSKALNFFLYNDKIIFYLLQTKEEKYGSNSILFLYVDHISFSIFCCNQ
jgi:hypothetical protein